MEILKFDESGSSSPSRKRSGRGAILVAFVAVVFGASTALASGTLTINEGVDIELAQGVTQTTQCDTSVDISLDSALEIGSPSKFYLHGISVTKIADLCLLKTLRLKVYNSTGDLQTFCDPETFAGTPLVHDGGDAGCGGAGTYVESTPTPGGAGLNTLNFTFTNTLEIADENSAKNIVLETIS
jgi:hypothetical protein